MAIFSAKSSTSRWRQLSLEQDAWERRNAQVDIEGAEVGALPQWLESGLLQRVDQLGIELHLAEIHQARSRGVYSSQKFSFLYTPGWDEMNRAVYSSPQNSFYSPLDESQRKQLHKVQIRSRASPGFLVYFSSCMFKALESSLTRYWQNRTFKVFRN